MITEVSEFCRQWKLVTEGTIALMEALPPEQYDFRADPKGRSIGELAWHLAEVDAYTALGIDRRTFEGPLRPANIERPRTIEALAPAFRTVHNEARERIVRLEAADLDQRIPYLDGAMTTIRDVLWLRLLQHQVHHRGQLLLQCRLAGGVPPPLYGRTRELTPVRQVASTS